MSHQSKGRCRAAQIHDKGFCRVASKSKQNVFFGRCPGTMTRSKLIYRRNHAANSSDLVYIAAGLRFQFLSGRLYTAKGKQTRKTAIKAPLTTPPGRSNIFQRSGAFGRPSGIRQLNLRSCRSCYKCNQKKRKRQRRGRAFSVSVVGVCYFL